MLFLAYCPFFAGRLALRLKLPRISLDHRAFLAFNVSSFSTKWPAQDAVFIQISNIHGHAHARMERFRQYLQRDFLPCHPSSLSSHILVYICDAISLSRTTTRTSSLLKYIKRSDVVLVCFACLASWFPLVLGTFCSNQASNLSIENAIKFCRRVMNIPAFGRAALSDSCIWRLEIADRVSTVTEPKWPMEKSQGCGGRAISPAFLPTLKSLISLYLQSCLVAHST